MAEKFHQLPVWTHAVPADFRPWGGDPEDVEKSIGYAYQTDSRDHKFSETAWAACSRSWRLEMLLKNKLELTWLLR